MKMMKITILSVLCAMTLQLSAAPFKMAGSSIYVDKAQPKTVQEAAKELQYHIKLSTGLDLPVVHEPTKGKMIVVGDNAVARKAGIHADKMEYQAHRILTKGDHLYIVGRDIPNDAKVESGGYSFGTLYAVYSFLSKTMGIRWILPTEQGTYIPDLGKNYVVPEQDVTFKPAFQARIMYIPRVWQRSPEYRQWMQRNYHKLPNLRNVQETVFGSLGIGFDHSWERVYPKKKTEFHN